MRERNHDEACYAKKITNKWRENPIQYNSMFSEKDEFPQRKNKFLYHRPAVHAFLSKGSLGMSKGRDSSPDWVYRLVLKKKNEKRQMDVFLKTFPKIAKENQEFLL